MHAVHVEPLSLERLEELLPPERQRRLHETAARARDVLDGRVVWNVNATAQGGGVAEMLQSLLAYVLAAGVDTRWRVLAGDARFFATTKRIHNLLHGQPGDGGPLGDDERAHYEEVLSRNLTDLVAEVSAGDVVLLHDPQTAGLVQGLRDVGAHVVWRCHIGRDVPNAETDRGWAFLRPYVEGAQAVVFSRRAYAPGWVPSERLHVIPPSIDPFSAKNRDLDAGQVADVLAAAGLVAGGRREPLTVSGGDGTTWTVRPHTDLLVDGSPPPPNARLVVQVSRWDRLKDMAGVLTAFAGGLGTLPGDIHLVLAGPDVRGVTDDPEGAAVLAECTELWRALPDDARPRVHLATLPMDDLSENAVIVNALQRHAHVVVQKSLVEGFGLTVTEAMWKARPLVASAVGGILDQIVDGRDGILLHDPSDLDALAGALTTVLDDDTLAARLGHAARERVQDVYLGDRHLGQYVDLFASLVA